MIPLESTYTIIELHYKRKHDRVHLHYNLPMNPPGNPLPPPSCSPLDAAKSALLLATSALTLAGNGILLAVINSRYYVKRGVRPQPR